MNKINFLLILLLALKINTSSAQSGIDASFSPFNKYVDFADDLDNKFLEGYHTSFRLGYFKWINEDAMLKLSLQMSSITNDNFFSVNSDYNTFPTTYIKNKYKFESTSYVFRYEAIGINNEIDFKSHLFFRSSYLFGLRNTKIGISGTERTENDNSQYRSSNYYLDSYNGEELNGTSYIFGIEYGLGYQYNITKLIGVYADANIGFMLISTFFYDANVGVRYRLK
jgi:hypothetical protein